MTSYTLELPDLPVYNANSRGHWRQRAEQVKAWREMVCWLARADRIPPLDAVEVELMMIPADRRRRDCDNTVGVLKPCIDGLRDAGVLAEDHAQIVQAVTCRITHPQPSLPAHRWLLTIWTLPAEDDAVA